MSGGTGTPKNANRVGARSMVSTRAPTLLAFFGVPVPPDMQGRPLGATLADGRPVREAALSGPFGAQVHVTDGRYVYMRGPSSAENDPLIEHTLMLTHMRSLFEPEELCGAELAPPFASTKGVPLLRIPARTPANRDIALTLLDTLLHDLEVDPAQEHPLDDPTVEARMVAHLVRLMRKSDAPPEQYARLGLTGE